VGNLLQLSDVKTYLQIGFTTDDTLLNQLIANVSLAIENYCNRSLSAAASFSDVLDGGVETLILTRRPIVAIAAIVDRTGRISQEQIGSGNNSQTIFPLTLKNVPLQSGNPGSVQIVAGAVQALDDGNGNLSGTGISSGSINYNTGVGTITLSAAPGAGVLVKAAYNPLSAIVDPSTYESDAKEGVVRPLPEPPTFPLPGGLFDFVDGAAIWGFGRRRFQVLYTAGFATVPADVQQAALIMIAARYNRRDDLTHEQVGDYAYNAETGQISGLPPQVEQLLSPYREIFL
jgi:hypothetical protein